eukprot:TRINITY_DN6438_c0_g1_i1.p1 TRINITY_DN6438_c0_g1~~TRINITY_DN6438_c0_g1_i1.p1  ORF type:complete len:134 (-),score=21.30 TRINITY_DN6438_c0_g1_i1:263-664(-)
MVFTETILRCADNSGAQLVKCIGFLRGRRRFAYNGERIRVAVQTYKPSKLASINQLTPLEKKKKIRYALIISCGKQTRRNDYYVKFDNRRCVLLGDDDRFLGTKIVGPVCKEVRSGNGDQKYKKLLTYAPALI